MSTLTSYKPFSIRYYIQGVGKVLLSSHISDGNIPTVDIFLNGNKIGLYKSSFFGDTVLVILGKESLTGLKIKCWEDLIAASLNVEKKDVIYYGMGLWVNPSDPL